MLDDFFDQYASRYSYAKPGEIWCYEDGCVYRGLVELSRATGDDRWTDHLKRLIAHQIDQDGNLRGYTPTEYNIDNILSGRVLFALRESSGDRFDHALDLLGEQLANHPRTVDGNFWHKMVYPHQVWLDGLYMGLPFQIEYALLRGRPELVDDATDQLLGAIRTMKDAATGLYFHGYDQSRSEAWSNPETGLSPGIWGRSNGWLAMGMIDAYELLPEAHPARAKLEAAIVQLIDALLKHRTPNGLWLQVMDQPDLPGNYEETSCSAMFAYALLKSARLIDGAAGFADEGIAALSAMDRLYVLERDHAWQLGNVCEVAGLGGLFGKPRDGTPEYYVSEPIVSNDPKAVGPLMMAVAEQERFASVTQRKLKISKG